jgi:predicted nucleic acid-binding protein
VARIVLLDSGPLGLACSRPGIPQVDRCHAWLLALEAASVEIIIPAIADYEVRRELLRLGATTKLKNLDVLRARFDYLDISGVALDRAAAFWALLRQGGLPTAGPDDLDADAILGGMAATVGQPGDTVTIATTNVRHLGRFPGIDAQLWSTIA